MTADKKFCMNSYLMFRYVYDEEKCFSERRPCRPVKLDFERMPVVDSGSLQNAIKSVIDRVCAQGKAALALSGGGRFGCFGKDGARRYKSIYFSVHCSGSVNH